MPTTITKKSTEGIDLYEFLKNHGFKIPDREELVSRHGWGGDYALAVASSDNTHVGTIYKTSENPVKYEKIEIIYYLNAAQVEDVLELKELLDKNNIKYENHRLSNKKSISHIASRFRKDAERLNSLADRLEKK